MRQTFLLLAFAIFLSAATAPARAQDVQTGRLLDLLERASDSSELPAATAVPFASEAWVFGEGATHRIENHLGRESLYLDGRAYVEGAAFRDGIVEVDVAPNTDPSFAGLLFRVQPAPDSGLGRANFEEVYLRLHKSGLPDAVQYSPIYNGESTWQLYREHQAAEEFKRTSWTRLKVVVAGERAEVYLDDASTPSLVVDRLRHGYGEGAVGLFALFGNHFANFRYTPVELTDPPVAEADSSAEGTVLRWALSPVKPAADVQAETYPGEATLETMDWITAEAEPSGLLPISKYRARPESGAFEQNPEAVAWARLSVETERAQTKKLFFDYSDKAVVFLNGQPVFAGNNAFLSKGPLERGDLGIEGNALFLDLREGANELLVAVTERANGWGLMAQFEDPTGLRLPGAP